jgi:hypothetical protein
VNNQKNHSSANSETSQSVKRTYRKPRIESVEMRPHEALLGACKTSSSAGPASPTCSTLSCSSLGS